MAKDQDAEVVNLADWREKRAGGGGSGDDGDDYTIAVTLAGAGPRVQAILALAEQVYGQPMTGGRLASEAIGAFHALLEVRSRGTRRLVFRDERGLCMFQLFPCEVQPEAYNDGLGPDALYLPKCSELRPVLILSFLVGVATVLLSVFLLS